MFYKLTGVHLVAEVICAVCYNYTHYAKEAYLKIHCSISQVTERIQCK